MGFSRKPVKADSLWRKAPGDDVGHERRQGRGASTGGGDPPLASVHGRIVRLRRGGCHAGRIHSYGVADYNPGVSHASSLYRLQELDLAIDRASARLAEIDRLLGGSAAVRAARAADQKARAALQLGQAGVKEAEHSVAGQRAKLETAERALYGGSVHNPKELQDLQADVESLKRHLAVLEDRALETMMALEELEGAGSRAAEALASAETAQRTEHASLAVERQQLLARTSTLQAEREAALAGVAERDLALYSRLRESMGGNALALLRDDSCGACGVGLSAAECQTVRNRPEPVRCHQCGRILYAG